MQKPEFLEFRNANNVTQNENALDSWTCEPQKFPFGIFVPLEEFCIGLLDFPLSRNRGEASD